MTGDLSVPAPQPNPSTEDGWVRFYFDDADPVAECACGWHTHGDSASDAFGAWWKHRREHDDAAGEQRPVVLSARVDLDLDQIEARANAATARPWDHKGWHRSPHGESYAVWRGKPEGSYPIAQTERGLQGWHDAEFIAHAREDVPRLVAEVRRLRQALNADNSFEDLWNEEQDRADKAEGDFEKAFGKAVEANNRANAAVAERDALRAENERLREALQAVRDWAEGDYGGVKRPIDVWPGLRRALDAALGDPS